MDITDFVIDNCRQQNATEPKDYIGMTRACNRALKIGYFNEEITVQDILRIGGLVNNVSDICWRIVPVTFANGNSGIPASTIDHAIERLLEFQKAMSPEDFYREFERIHPFVDGNGRTGAILFNALTKDFWTNPPEMTW